MGSAVLLDLDGVLYVEDQAVPGAVEAVQRLRAMELGLRFVTNTTTRTRGATLERLERLGFQVGSDELLTPVVLARELCRERGHRRVALLVAPGTEVDFEGLEPVAGDSGGDAVVVGDLGDGWTYAALNRAFRLVMDGAELIALQRNRFWLRGDGLALDAGPFVAALEYATGRSATVVGKPSRAFFEQALAGLGVDAGDAVMVGDDIESDIGGALDAGLRALLVRTGKYRADVVRASGIEPTGVVDSIADVPGSLASSAEDLRRRS
jgi:phospholysine phosphohistidine inorganic pyrophosphate phosphatase